MIYYISDLHFGHDRVIQMDQRPFSNVDRMDQALIERWNAQVQDDDEVYVIGDFCYRSKHPEAWYLRQLRGRKHLVIGNHDSKLLKNSVALEFFETVQQIASIDDDGRWIIMCHYPMVEWPGSRRNSYHIYGHIHNRINQTHYIMSTRDRAYNAGCMLHNFAPVTLQELIDSVPTAETMKSIRWYYEAVRGYLILNYAMNPDDADRALCRCRLWERLRLYTGEVLHDSIEATVQDMEEKGYLQDGILKDIRLNNDDFPLRLDEMCGSDRRVSLEESLRDMEPFFDDEDAKKFWKISTNEK